MKEENGWQVKTFGEIFDLKQGKHLPLDVLNDGVYPVFGANGRVGHYDKFMYEEATLLVTCRGATCGSINLTEPNSWVTGNAIALVPKEKIVNSFFYYQLKNQSFRDVISGSAQPQIIVGLLKNKKVLLPPLRIQKQIAEILEKADGAKQKRKEVNKLTDEFVQSVFIEMFGDPVKNPKGWEKEKFENLGKLARGKSKHRPRNAPFLLGGKYPLIQTSEIVNSFIYIKNYTQTYSEEGLRQSKLWPKGTLCISIAANIGFTAILNFDACFPDSIVGFTPNNKVISEYIHYYFKFIQKQLEEYAPQSAQKNINLEILSELEISLPPLPLQQEFAEIVNKTEALKEKQKQSERELENLFQSLMQRAFKGELV